MTNCTTNARYGEVVESRGGLQCVTSESAHPKRYVTYKCPYGGLDDINSEHGSAVFVVRTRTNMT